jgi:hypothetical protein
MPASASFGMAFAPSLRVSFKHLEISHGDSIVVRADLPGVRKEDVQIDVTDGELTISGERREEGGDDQAYRAIERKLRKLLHHRTSAGGGQHREADGEDARRRA